MKTLLSIALLFSTVLGVKDTIYIARFERFVDKFIEKHENFTNEEWEENIAKYVEFRNEYSELAADMSSEQRDKVTSLQYKVNALIIKHKAAKAFGSVGEFVNEAAGTLKELTEMRKKEEGL